MARTEPEWTEWTKRLLKAELTRRGITYGELAKRLHDIGVDDSERNISNKISRGGFSATYFFQIMEAIGVKTLHLGADE